MIGFRASLLAGALVCLGATEATQAAQWRMRIELPGEQIARSLPQARPLLHVAAGPAKHSRARHRSPSRARPPLLEVATALPADARDPARNERPRPDEPPKPELSHADRGCSTHPSPYPLPQGEGGSPKAYPLPQGEGGLPKAYPLPQGEAGLSKESPAAPCGRESAGGGRDEHSDSSSLALSVTPEASGRAILLPFGKEVGAAALVRGDQILVVFDAPKPLDVAPLREDPAFSSAVVEVLPTATVVRLRAQAGRSPALTREPEGWRLSLTETPTPSRPIETNAAGGALAMAASRPGRVIAMTDPLSRAALLVGTQLEPGQAIEALRRTPEFALLHTLQGVAVEPLSDRLALEPTKDGFRLSGVGGALALAPRSLPDQLLADADGLTHRLDMPVEPRAALAAKLDQNRVLAATAPPLGRSAPRLAAARTAIALGLGQEALGMLRAVAIDDPHLTNDPERLALEGVAAVLAHRPEEAKPLLAPGLTGTDEIALWRALREALLIPAPDQAPAVASALASSAPLLLTYPDAVRRRMLPLALEAMQAGGQAKAAGRLLAARPDDPSLGLARAVQAEADGDVKSALASYDALAAGHDRFDRIRASLRAINLRLAGKLLTPQQGIEALERLDAAWRGDRTELAVRERLAALHLEMGAWQPALALLRDSAAQFPDEAAALRSRMQDAVARLLADDATRAMPPLDFVALLQENADLLGAAATGPAMQTRLADRLLALDLPDAAAPLLERLMRDAPPDAGRAASGARLAALRLAMGDGPGAQAALVGSEVAADLPPALVERRTLLAAQAAAQAGDVTAAAASLVSVGTAEADRARADMLERAGDLPGAVAALTALADRVVPAKGALDAPARAVLLRLAAAATRARDPAALTALKARIAGRFGDADGADSLRLLLAEPVRQLADLARAGKEAALAGAAAAELRGPTQPGPASR